MPELPDITIYVQALEARVVGEPLDNTRVRSPFLLRTYDPPLEAAHGRRVLTVERIGKRIVLGFEDELFVVLHLMIAGRLRWKERLAKVPQKVGLAGFDFPQGTLLLTEASPKKRASLHVVRGRAALGDFDRGGLEVLIADLESFEAALKRENRTLKRALTDPRLFSGIGNAYSDEILHRARLSPLARTQSLDDAAVTRLYDATRSTLDEWIDRLGAELRDAFPDKVTAFRDGMAAHGRYSKPCPVCTTPIQRIVYAENECNYCPECQTGGKLLADRALSRLLRGDWPKTLEELEELRSADAGVDAPEKSAPPAASQTAKRKAHSARRKRR